MAEITGTAGADALNGTSGDDRIFGLDGDDVIGGGDGNDYVEPGEGDDTVTGGAGDDYIVDVDGPGEIYGGDGRDVITVGPVSDFAGTLLIDGGNSNDTINVSMIRSGSIVARGGSGFDAVVILDMLGTLEISLGGSRDTVGFYAGMFGQYGDRLVALSAITITDLAEGDSGDVIDWDRFLGLTLTGWDQSANPFSTGHLRLLQSGTRTLVQIDPDGGGDDYGTLLTLRNMTATTLTAANFDDYDPSGAQAVGQTIDGTEGFDAFLGTVGDDVIHVFGGGSQVHARGGADEIFGGSGEDQLHGEVGHDTIDGAGADDVLHGDTGDDTLIGGEGDDFIDGDVGDDIIDGGEGDDSLLAGTGVDSVIGGEGDDYLYKAGIGSGDLVGGNGNDTLETFSYTEDTVITLDGGAGDDILIISASSGAEVTAEAGSGNDTVSIEASGGQSVVDFGAGTDTLAFTVGLSAFLDSGVVLTDFVPGPTGERLEWGDFLTSNLLGWDETTDPFATGYLRLIQSGTSTLLQVDPDGATSNWGFVTLATFQNAVATDFTTENLGGYSLIPVKNGTAKDDLLIGTAAAERLNGLASGDTIRGNGGADLLVGGSGDDRLDGGTGIDRHYGGTGNDLFEIDNVGDKVFELAGQGTDLVRSLVDFTLSANVENLTLMGTAAIDGTGNVLANIVTGNGAANLLAGGDGDDVLNGVAGADEMRGGRHDDLYIVDVGGDIVVELAGQGIDTVRSSVSYALAANVEHLVLSGGGHINGTGNGLANAITGNNGNNRLDGGAGADTLSGGAGHDTYVVDHLGDQVIEAGSSGNDTVESAVSFQLPTHVEKLILTGSLGYDGRGNNAANTITGNSGGNFLNGGRGNDVIDAGGGSDWLMGHFGNDTLKGGAGADRFYFNVAPGGADADRILDLSAADDGIYLLSSVFGGTGPNGTLAASAFHQGSSAADAGDRIVYDAATGNIFYDADGTGAAAALLFATVNAGTPLTHADFVIYG